MQLREEIQRKVHPGSVEHRMQGNMPAALSTARVVQAVLDLENVREKASQFLACHEKESELIGKANVLLTNYSKDATPANFAKLNKDLPGIRDEITKQTDLQAGIIAEYAACKTEAVRKTFLDTVLAKDATELRPLFDKLLDQTTLAPERQQEEGSDQVKYVDEKFKYRFLSYVLQSSKYATGEGRFRELMGLLGDRNVVIDKLPYSGPKAGLADPDTDNPKSEKTDARDKAADAELLKQSGGNLAEYIKAKRELDDTRTENPRKGELGNVTVLMDSSQQLLPVYYGLTGEKEVEAYTSPLFTAIHHELGHVVNSLKGKGGRKADKYTGAEGALLSLTDEEELQNISLDRFSDKAFTDELRLPERIAHGAFSGLDSATPKLDEQFVKEDFKKWDKLTYRMDGRRLELLQTIKALAAKNWDPYTKGGSKPDGVKEIATALTTPKSTRKQVMEQLGQIKGIADTSRKAPSKRRQQATKDFYAVVADLKFGSDEELAASTKALNDFAGKWFA
jgi:hypothetical protein